MGFFSTLISNITAVIKPNYSNEITGAIMQEALIDMITDLGKAQFGGHALTSTNPGTPEHNVFYIATSAGTYTHFGHTISKFGLHTFTYDTAAGIWLFKTINSIQDLLDETTANNTVHLKNGGRNVGIGTDNATQKLDVNGNIRARSISANENAGKILGVDENGVFGTVTKNWANAIFVQTANKTVSGTTLASIFGTGIGSLNIPATRANVGATYRAKIRGSYQTSSSGTNPKQVNVALFLNGINVGTTTIVFSLGITSNNVFVFEFEFTIRSVGATGSVMFVGNSVAEVRSAYYPFYYGIVPTLITVDTRSGITVDLRMAFVADEPVNNITSATAVVELLNP